MLQRRTRLARCHGLAPWRFTLAASLAARLFGVSSQREPPRGKPVASSEFSHNLSHGVGMNPSEALTAEPDAHLGAPAQRR